MNRFQQFQTNQLSFSLSTICLKWLRVVAIMMIIVLYTACQPKDEPAPAIDKAGEATAVTEATSTPAQEATAVPTPIAAPEQIADESDTPAVNAPKITYRHPSHNDITLVQPTFKVHFNQQMDVTSLQDAVSIEPSIPFSLELDGLDLFISLEEPLAFGTDYQIAVADTAVNQQGIPLRDDYTWAVRLKTAVHRVHGPTANVPDAPITIDFNYPMNDASVSTALDIKPAVSGKLVWSDDYQTATLTPDVPLDPLTTYSVSFHDTLLHRDGHEMPPPATALEFSTPPPILSQSPRGENVLPTEMIAIRFDRLMDELTTQAAFQIEPAIDGNFSWQETTLRFHPVDGYFAENTTYTVTILPDVRGKNGEQILEEAVSWHFTTSAARNIANFGYGPNAQVLDVNGRRAIQFQSQSRSDKTIGFELYALDLTQFLDKYSSNFKSNWWQNEPDNGDIDTSDSQLLKSWTIETTESPAEYANVQEVIIPDDVPPGLYILNLTAGRLNDQLILVLTENSVMVKEADGQILAWVTDINGAAIANATVGIYARSGDLISDGVTDEDGLFRAEIPPYEEGGPPALDPLMVVARMGDDVTISGLSGEWQNSSGYYSRWWGQSPFEAAAFIYTDRPIYKPGHAVQFKAVVRLDDDAELSVPPVGSQVSVRIRDGRDNVVQTFELSTNDFGTVNGTFQLAEGAMLGEYRVEVDVNGDRFSQIFKVEDYRKPDYEVTVSTEGDKFLAGDEIEVTVDTAYFFGEPVPNADITIRRFTGGEDYDYYYYDEYNNGERTWWEDWSTMDSPIKGTTDANGRFTTTIPVQEDNIYGGSFEWGSSLGVVWFGIEATVDDGSHQTVSGFAPVRLYTAVEKVTADTGSYVKKPGEPFTINANVESIFGEPVANRNLTIELGRWTYNNYAYDQVIQSAQMKTDENGRASTQFNIDEPGYYQLRVKGQDARGNHIQYTEYVYAFSDFYETWYGRNDGGIRIDTDKDEYAPGETAQLIVETTISGPALLTIERGSIRREKLVELTAPLTLIDLEIEAGDIPNVYVAINAWEPLDTTIQQYTSESLPDGRLHSAYHNISVPATSKRLTVTITPDKAQYAPREEATFTVRVTNYRGEPVSAEVSMALVDEAIFALSEELSGPMYNSFYYERNSVVNTYNSLQPRRYLWEGGMGGGGGDGSPPGGPRADFPDTAAWFPVLHTDFNGEASVTITLPDNLTTWRMTAKATTADTQVGETTANITTWQPIIVRPILPRALTSGDTAVISAIVHNYSQERQTLDVTLETGDSQMGLEIDGEATQTITVQPGLTQIVGWQVKVGEAGEIELLVTAVPQKEGVLGDAVQLPLTINPLAIPDVHTQIGQFNSELNTTIDVPNDALALSTVEIQLSRSIAGSLLEGLEYLTGYPYGCVEQTMSKALPNAVVGRALNQLGVTNPTLQAELPGYINASVQRLYGFQHNDGGWGWWYDDDSHDYQTAWVIFGLAQVADAGYEVDPNVIQRGVDWMNENYFKMDARTRAFALYAMAQAGHPHEERTLDLANDLDSLKGDVFSLAGLALALQVIGEDVMAREIVDSLADTAVNENGTVYWEGNMSDGYYHSKTMASDIRSTALALSAFTQIRPGHELEPGMVRWLMSQRRAQGWGSTNETSFAILGLTDHLLATAFSEASATTNYTIFLNGEAITQGGLGKGAPAVTLTIAQDQLQPGENEIRVLQDGERPLYYTINSRMYVAQEEIEAAGAIEIEREYLDPVTSEPLETIEAGELVKIRLRVNMPEQGSYMILEDRLPGGLEPLNERLNTTSHVAQPNDYYYDYDGDFRWRNLGYNYKEIFGDRVSFFMTEMDRGTFTVTYLARATHSGEFTAVSAEAYGMYAPQLWGRSASDQLTVVESE